MTKKKSKERKQRTRAHLIADLSVNFVERLALKCGYVVYRQYPDYGFDLRLETFDEQGQVEGEYISIQLKATDTIRDYTLKMEECFSFPVDTKDYRFWVHETVMPVYLILYDAVLEEAYWLDLQEFEEMDKPDVQGKTLNVHIPQRQVLGFQSLRLMRQRKLEILEASKGKQSRKGNDP
jgi:hypothetical protein